MNQLRQLSFTTPRIGVGSMCFGPSSFNNGWIWDREALT
jgi:hypothetical protein